MGGASSEIRRGDARVLFECGVLRRARRPPHRAPARDAHRLEPPLRARGRPGRGAAGARARRRAGGRPVRGRRGARDHPGGRQADRAPGRVDPLQAPRPAPRDQRAVLGGQEHPPAPRVRGSRPDGRGRPRCSSPRTVRTSAARSTSSRRSCACAGMSTVPAELPAIRPQRDEGRARRCRGACGTPRWRSGSARRFPTRSSRRAIRRPWAPPRRPWCSKTR